MSRSPLASHQVAYRARLLLYQFDESEHVFQLCKPVAELIRMMPQACSPEICIRYDGVRAVDHVAVDVVTLVLLAHKDCTKDMSIAGCPTSSMELLQWAMREHVQKNTANKHAEKSMN
jgi:Ni,Fe-hydrogenase III small subunit